jgi:hypothetical protein
MREWSRATLLLCFLTALGVGGARAAESGPSPALVKLEREIGLRIAHAREVGPVEPDWRRKLLEAQQYDAAGERALGAGDYKSAEDSFLHARRLLERIGM